MVIHPYAKFGIPMSKSKDNLSQINIYGENMILILRPKINVIQRYYIYVTHRLMVIHSCAMYGMTMGNDIQEAPGSNCSEKQF